MATTLNAENVILRWPETSQITGFRSKSHVEKMERNGLFPKSVKIGPRAKGWLKAEVEDWLRERIAQRDSGL